MQTEISCIVFPIRYGPCDSVVVSYCKILIILTMHLMIFLLLILLLLLLLLQLLAALLNNRA